MFLLTRPSPESIAKFLSERENDSHSYDDVGATSSSPPAGFDVDHNRALLGRGAEDFERAKSAIRQWKMFNVPGLELISSETPIEAGRNVALLAHHLGFYSLSSCRIVYVIDDDGPVGRFGFAYGTLTEHVEIGEERFCVELHRETGEVWYHIFAFSRPGHFMVKIGYPFARYLQKRFAVGSKAAMQRAVVSS